MLHLVLVQEIGDALGDIVEKLEERRSSLRRGLSPILLLPAAGHGSPEHGHLPATPRLLPAGGMRDVPTGVPTETRHGVPLPGDRDHAGGDGTPCVPSSPSRPSPSWHPPGWSTSDASSSPSTALPPPHPLSPASRGNWCRRGPTTGNLRPLQSRRGDTRRPAQGGSWPPAPSSARSGEEVTRQRTGSDARPARQHRT